ncbi:hypothetical protein P171DRAFT_53231 [Karstenula rhodostoma CBS 690.94]|uniref:Protein kinase domain-containing protein n=1 Tax=Karstenula rhodostoma CBS 690.94 TaxID=1392251 RepID=A0A9P4UBB8_9PLEO|nr:hypothetical protein P171DRAFT_53231 [Karstenula rhodostoma CBS 690.94]
MYEKETSAAWLCLPRHLDTTPAVEDSESEQEEHTAYPFDGHPSAAVSGHDANDNSSSQKLHRKALTQLVVVRMYKSPAALRNESDTLSIVNDSEGSEDFVGASVLRELHSGIPTDSWLCLRPIFGKNLEAFGQACLATNRIPTYFVWHIVLRLVSALEFVHTAGIVHGDLGSANVMLRCSLPGREDRDWPDVVLTGFEVEVDMDLYEDERREDVRRMSEILYTDVICRWSDAGTLIPFLNLTISQPDQLMQFAAALKTMVEAPLGEEVPSLSNFKVWKAVAVAEMAKGPGTCPAWIKIAAYDALVTEKELEKAMRPPLVLNFGPDSEKFKRWVRARRTPVALRKKGTRGNRIGLLVVKFKIRRERFANLD